MKSVEADEASTGAVSCTVSRNCPLPPSMEAAVSIVWVIKRSRLDFRLRREEWLDLDFLDIDDLDGDDATD